METGVVTPKKTNANKSSASNKKIQELEAEILRLKSNMEIPVAVDTNSQNESEAEIRQDEYINIMSLCPHILNLSTRGKGQGKNFKFTSFGQKKRLLYSELVDIMEYNSAFLENGVFYILDNRVVRKHGLDDTYAKILKKEQIEAVVSGNQDVALDLYKSGNKRQREFVDDLLIMKLKSDPESIDMNIVSAISKISGRNLEEIANEDFTNEE